MKKIISAGLLLPLSMLAGCNDTSVINDTVKKANYILVVPPSTDYGPGNLVARTKYDPKDAKPTEVTLQYICNPDYAVGQYGEPPHVADGENQFVSKAVGTTISVDASVLKSIANLSVTAAAAKEVKATIKDVKVMQYSLEDLKNIRDGLGRNCKRILNETIRSRNAYQIQQALKANVELDITFKANLKPEVEAGVKKELTTALSLGSASTDVNWRDGARVQGQGIIYGIRWRQLWMPLEAQEIAER